MCTTLIVAFLLAAGGARTESFAKRDPHTSRIEPADHFVATAATFRRQGRSESDLRLPPFVSQPVFPHAPRQRVAVIVYALAPAITYPSFRFTRSSRGPPLD